MIADNIADIAAMITSLVNVGLLLRINYQLGKFDEKHKNTDARLEKIERRFSRVHAMA
ncbi:MAG: hypothetical protein ACK5QX_11945 [bacterium]|jgi:hypothetical protein